MIGKIGRMVKLVILVKLSKLMSSQVFGKVCEIGSNDKIYQVCKSSNLSLLANIGKISQIGKIGDFGNILKVV